MRHLSPDPVEEMYLMRRVDDDTVFIFLEGEEKTTAVDKAGWSETAVSLAAHSLIWLPITVFYSIRFYLSVYSTAEWGIPDQCSFVTRQNCCSYHSSSSKRKIIVVVVIGTKQDSKIWLLFTLIIMFIILDLCSACLSHCRIRCCQVRGRSVFHDNIIRFFPFRAKFSSTKILKSHPFGGSVMLCHLFHRSHPCESSRRHST